MASLSDEDLTCPVCRDIFKDPVVLTCSHSFCKVCLQDWWSENHQHLCPVCMRRSSRSDPPRNLALKNLCESFGSKRNQRSAADSEDLCSLHTEKLKLFCVDHQQPICVVCLHSESHHGHSFKPIGEAAQDHKEKIQTLLKSLQARMKIFHEVKEKCDQTAEYIEAQAQRIQRQIRKQFKKLHQFLEEEEEARISALRKEEEQKRESMKEKIQTLNIEIAALSDSIRTMEKELRAEDVSILKNYKTEVKRVQQRPLLDDPELVSGALIDEAKHLGNLSFNIWTRMKETISYTPVILDLNSADPDLLVSENLTGVKRRDEGKRPKNPEISDSLPIVLGSEGFTSGSHSWDVEVGESGCWSLGVAAKFVQKKRELKSRLWRMEFSDEGYKAISLSAKATVLSVKRKLQQVRVDLDCDQGTLTFTDLKTKTCIHTFTHTFTEELFPFIGNGDEKPIEILPRDTD